MASPDDIKPSVFSLYAGDAWYRHFVETLEGYSIFSMNVVGIIETWNMGSQVLFGYTAGEMIGRDSRVIFTPEDVALRAPQEEIDIALARHMQRNERWHLRKDGSRFWGSGLMMSIRTPEGVPVGFVKIMRDRTEHKAMMDALHQTEERYRLLNKATNDVIWDWDLRTDYLTWNDAVEAHFGWTPAELGTLIDGWKSRIHPEDRDRVFQGLRQAIDLGEQMWSQEYRFRHRDGEYRVFFDRGFIARDSTGKAYRMIGSMLNTSHDTLTERSLRETQGRLEEHVAEVDVRVRQRTNKLEQTIHALETFSYSASHDLRAPLRAITAYAEILLEDQAERLDADAMDKLGRIHRSALRMNQLIDDVLAYSRAAVTELTLAPVDLNVLADEVLEDAFFGQATRDSHIEVDRPLPWVHANAEALRRAIANLVSNAVKFVPQGRKPHVRIWAQRDSGRVRLWIEDNGIGIDTAQRGRIYNLFERLHPSEDYPGTGVGLAIVRQTILRMGGTTGFESEVGHGSRFWIELAAAA